MTSAAYRHHWTEPRIEPVEMNDTEILDFLSEYMIAAQQIRGDREFPPLTVLIFDHMETVRGRTLRKAVMLAKAKFDEENS